MKKDYITITILAIVLAAILGFSIYTRNEKKNNIPIYQNNNGDVNDNKDKIFTIKKYGEEKDIKKDGKINIYFFWREGCEHCKAQFAYLEENFYKYVDKCNIYCFEVLQNENNHDLMAKFSKALGEDIHAIPFTITGDKYEIGFSFDASDDLKNLIENEINNSEHIDLYFDKIKKENIQE